MQFHHVCYQQVPGPLYLFMSLFSHWLSALQRTHHLVSEGEADHFASTPFWLETNSVFFLIIFMFFINFSPSWLASPEWTTSFFRYLWSFQLNLCGDIDSTDPINAFQWGKALDIHCSECVQATNYLIKMGNKQTIFTDEQLDAYQVSWHAAEGLWAK